MALADPWYELLATRYGEEYCKIAGYFEETKPFSAQYATVFDLPKNIDVIQFSGAFHPFHEGHLSIVEQAIQYLRYGVFVVIHADHHEYRNTKGTYDEEKFLESFNIMDRLDCDWLLITEDKMPNGCSRNFTRLYTELEEMNSVWFLSGGDRASYSLTFRDAGRCIIAGRDTSPMYQKYQFLSNTGGNKNITFLPGNHGASSTAIRQS
jgi:hypothetical protein